MGINVAVVLAVGIAIEAEEIEAETDRGGRDRDGSRDRDRDRRRDRSPSPNEPASQWVSKRRKSNFDQPPTTVVGGNFGPEGAPSAVTAVIERVKAANANSSQFS